jgi:hypothetical protein
MFTFKRGPGRPRPDAQPSPGTSIHTQIEADPVIGVEIARQMAPPGDGRARYLLYGPYAALGPGRWRATVFLHLCPDAARRPLAVQFGAEPDYTTLDLPFGVPGNHRVDLEHSLREGDAAQVRLWLKKAAFHGEVRLIGVSLGRAEAGAAPIGEDHV